MSRRRSRDTGGAWIFLLFKAGVFVATIVGVILLTAAIYAPVILLAALLIYEFRLARLPIFERPTPETLSALQALESEFGRVDSRLAMIDQEGAHLKTNLDGTFHRGSRLGQRLNDERQQLEPRHETLADAIVAVRNGPLDTFRKWVSIVAWRDAFRYALLAWGAVATVVYVSGSFRRCPVWLIGTPC